jgi:predicted dehydrogenase
MTDESTPISRRTFVRDGATAAAALAMAPMIVPRHVLGGVGYRAPSRTLNVAMIGFGGMGMSNMNALLQAGENIVAVCDIDYGYVERSIASRVRPRQGQTTAPPDGAKLQEAYTKAKKYDDFRTMFDKQKDIDAVVIATPDHLHAIAAYVAMKHGKHVYVQKPLTYTVQEARLLARTARDTKVVTQMGNQGHSMEGTRRINELIAAGVLGPIREVHMWTDRPARFWAQGIPRPGTAIPT